MTTYHDVPADLLIGELSARLSEMEAISPPEWSSIVKTGTHRERPPSQDNWWFIRSAAILRKVGKLGPIGANHMAQHFGGPKDRGVKPNRAVAGQLFECGITHLPIESLRGAHHVDWVYLRLRALQSHHVAPCVAYQAVACSERGAVGKDTFVFWFFGALVWSI